MLQDSLCFLLLAALVGDTAAEVLVDIASVGSFVSSCSQNLLAELLPT